MMNISVWKFPKKKPLKLISPFESPSDKKLIVLGGSSVEMMVANLC